MNPQDRDEKIQKWNNLCAALAIVKEQEMKLRKEIVEYVTEGKHSCKMNLGFGYGLDAENTLNYKIDDPEDKLLSLVEWLKQNNETEVFKQKWEFNESNYKKVSPTVKAYVDELISCKPGSPKLTFIQPKEG